MMGTPRIAWVPVLVLLSTAGLGLVTVGNLFGQYRLWVVLWFLLVCPGMALLPLLRLKQPALEISLGVALSLALDTMVAGIMLYAGLWSPEHGLLVLAGITVSGAVLQVVLGERSTARQRFEVGTGTQFHP